MQAVAAVEHENFKRRHTKFGDCRVHLVNMAGFDGRHVKTVVHPEIALRTAQYLGNEFAPRTTTVEVILAGAHVIEAGGHPAHGRSLALA